MTIGIDIRVLTRGTRTGVEEYVLNLLPALFSLDKSIKYKLFYNAYHKAALNYPWLDLPNVELCEFKIPNRLLFATARYLSQPRIDRLLNGVDPVRSKSPRATAVPPKAERTSNGVDTYFNPHFFVAPVSRRCRKVMTFHDLSFEHHPQLFGWRKRIWQNFLMATRQEARQADKIIAVSESTKQDLVNLYGIEPEKIKVIYSGISTVILSGAKRSEESRRKSTGSFVDAQDDRRIRKKYNLPEKFILYFGTIEPRKNLIGLIKAFELLNSKLQTQHLKLVIAGAKGWLYEDVFRVAQQSKYSRDIIFTGFVEEEDKPYLYHLAELFVYPSFFEGFGFPPLEAMAGGVPTIVSNNSSFPEVVGDAAIMIDPYKIDELAWAMEMVLSDRDLRQKLEKKGIEQAQKFSWSKCAQQTLKILISR